MIERTRVHLPDRQQHPIEAQVLSNLGFKFTESRGVPTDQIQHVLRRSNWALDATQRVPGEQRFQPVECSEQLVGERREPFAQRGHLGGNIVRASGQRNFVVLDGQLSEPSERRDGFVTNQQQRLPDLQLLDVFGQVARGHALVDVLVSRERVELLDACLHVVAGDPFTLGDRCQVHVVGRSFVRADGVVRDVDAEFALCLEYSDPQLPSSRTLFSGAQIAVIGTDA